MGRVNSLLLFNYLIMIPFFLVIPIYNSQLETKNTAWMATSRPRTDERCNEIVKQMKHEKVFLILLSQFFFFSRDLKFKNSWIDLDGLI